MDVVKVYVESDSSSSSEWRSFFKENVKDLGIELFSENSQFKEQCDYVLYVFTPSSNGVSAIINAVNDSNHLKEKTIFCVLSDVGDNNFTAHQEKSLIATGKMIELNGGKWFTNSDDVIQFIRRVK